MNIGSSESIWGYRGPFDGEEGSSLFSLGGGGGVVKYQGAVKEKSPEFRSQEVGISAVIHVSIGKKIIWMLPANIMLFH